MNKIKSVSRVGQFLLIALIALSCSLPVRPTNAPTDPPKLELKSFESHWFAGQYEQLSAPKMFLWPIEIIDGSTGELRPMTLEEQAASRTKIVFSAEKIQDFESEILRVQTEINEKYDLLTLDLESEFKQNKCYSYCDPEDFIFCDPDDDSVLFIEDWICIADTPEPEDSCEPGASCDDTDDLGPSPTIQLGVRNSLCVDDPDEKDIVLQCQQNQEIREGLEGDKNRELSQRLTPLREQAAYHGRNFFEELGDNYYTEFTFFAFKLTDDEISIQLRFGDKFLSNEAQTPTQYQIYDIHLDRMEGYLSFRSPSFDGQGQRVGEFFYDLELTFTDSTQLKVEGDVRFIQGGVRERVGRFSSAGNMRP
jgi:hypothetical protein